LLSAAHFTGGRVKPQQKDGSWQQQPVSVVIGGLTIFSKKDGSAAQLRTLGFKLNSYIV
jgi:hypothetical protein